jgi:transglutaminase-like putative cysteine protease
MFTCLGFVSNWPEQLMRIQSQLTLKQLFWITLAVLIASLPQVYRLPFWFLPMTIAVVTFRFYAQINQVKKAYNRILAIIAIIVMLMIIYSQGFGISREISVTILITMTVLKLLETYTMRDALMVVMLCYFVTMTRFLYSQDLLLVVYLIGSALVTTHALSILNYEKNKRWFDSKQMKSTAGSLTLAIPFAILFFLIFPRLGSPIWGSPDIFGEGKTGISDTMSPGSIVDLFMDDSPAFRVTFKNKEIPPNNKLYWRGPVLWNFDGVTWSRKKQWNLRNRIVKKNQSQLYEYQIEMEGTGQNYMFGLDYVTEAPSGAFVFPDSILYSTTKINQLRHYDLSSLLIDRFYQPISRQDKNQLLDYPKNQNLRTQEKINVWLSEVSDKNQIINKTLQMFNQEAFYYSYTPPPLSGDVIDQFIFDSKRGFCEHYASAFTVMMRMAGIPARVVTGYQGGIDNGEYLLVKQSDAHAWSEVYIEENNRAGYWLRIDPTSMVAPERVEQGSRQIINQKRSFIDFPWLISMKESMDKYRYQWNKWVREFNVTKQQALFEAFGIAHRDGKSLALLMVGILFITGLLSLLPIWWLKRKKYHSLQRIYLELVGLVKKNPELYSHKNKGVENFINHMKVAYPQAKTQLNHFLDTYISARYGQKANQRQETISHLRTTLQKIKGLIKA